jgi:hypothetical protein
MIGAFGFQQGHQVCTNAVSMESSSSRGCTKAFLRLSYLSNILERALYDRDGPPDASWLHKRRGYIMMLKAQLAEHRLRATHSNMHTEAMVIGMNTCTLMQVCISPQP